MATIMVSRGVNHPHTVSINRAEFYLPSCSLSLPIPQLLVQLLTHYFCWLLSLITFSHYFLLAVSISACPRQTTEDNGLYRKMQERNTVPE